SGRRHRAAALTGSPASAAAVLQHLPWNWLLHSHPSRWKSRPSAGRQRSVPPSADRVFSRTAQPPPPTARHPPAQRQAQSARQSFWLSSTSTSLPLFGKRKLDVPQRINLNQASCAVVLSVLAILKCNFLTGHRHLAVHAGGE